uniref:Gustatory receptor n=1 Tax=Parastrongyloides trichosuri TaxID=131310 RepID=A0A0N4ZY04_PARTI
MPFFPIEFSTNEISASIHRKVNYQLESLKFPRKILSLILGVEISYPRPNNSCLRCLMKFHKTLLILVSIALLIVIIYQTTVHVATYNYLANCGRALLVIQKCMGYVDLILLISWQWFNKEEKFNKKLHKSSNGIGLLKNKNEISRTHLIIFIYALLRGLILFGFDVIIVFDKQIENQNLSTYFPAEIEHIAVFLLPTTLFLFMCTPIVYSILGSYLLIIISEYDKLSADLSTDGNIYQLPVIRHYIGAHMKLCSLFAPLKQILSIRVDAQVPLNICVIITLVFSFTFSKITRTPLDNALDIFLLLDSTIHIITILGISSVVWSKVTKIREQIVSLVASERVLNEQSFSVIAAYITYLQRDPRPISIFQFSYYNRTFLMLILTVGCVVYLLYHLQHQPISLH